MASLTVSSAPALQRVIMVGNVAVKEDLSRLVKQYTGAVQVELDPQVKEANELIFGRDSRVIGLNGVHIIPHEITDPFVAERFKSLLPFTSDPFIRGVAAGVGIGFEKPNVETAIAYAEERKIPYKKSRCSVEGGNCFIFCGSDKQPRAIVGAHSVVLSMIGLEEQGFFKEHEKALKDFAEAVSIPSDDALRMARNAVIYTKKRDLDARFAAVRELRRTNPSEASKQLPLLQKELADVWKGESGYRELLTKPLSEEDRKLYHEEACLYDAKIALTKQVISEDLGVDMKNIAFVPQRKFHIDMEMTIDVETGVVFLHTDDWEMPGYASSALSRYHKEAQKHALGDKELLAITIKALSDLGCKVVKTPAVFEASGELNVNFLNGIFLRDSAKTVFVTNGVKGPRSPLIDIFQRAFPIKCDFVDPALMEKVLNEGRGGVHCLTWETAALQSLDDKKAN